MQVGRKTVQNAVLISAIIIATLFAAKLYVESREKAAGIESWIPVLKLPDGEVAKELLATENSRHLFVRTESEKLYSLWSDEQGGYPTFWRQEESLPEQEDSFGHCNRLQADNSLYAIDHAPTDAKPYVNCFHVILHSAVRCNSIYALAQQRSIYVWGQCEGPGVYYLFDYYLPRISSASCLQKGESKC